MLFVKKKKPEQLKAQTKPVNYYCVICATDIEDMSEPPFSISQYLSKDEYRKFLEEFQPLIIEYSKNGFIKNDFPSWNNEPEIKDFSSKERFMDLFLDNGNHINVIKKNNGKYSVLSNGRHRMYIAKEYGFQLLVHVAEEEIQ